MKRKFIATACMSLLGLSAAVPAFADNEDDTASTCSIATMLGTYVWAYAATNAGGPYSTSGRESYDGHGNFKWFQLFNSGGTATFTYSGTGTYTMTADCVASVVYAGFHANAPYTYFVAPSGSGYYWNNNFADGTVAGGHVVRITKALLVY
ncbi:MAG TPA: hypothetical protein VNZ53_55405 [Steroidobacteraceae bacterium]|jgi:hypothetical protein|nr:hypothetical protein [Steroidobacteraceae bacterium]